MFPIGDDDVHGGGLTPFITWGLILLNVLAWMLELAQGSDRAHVPALVVLGFWILIQFNNGMGSVVNTPETGGVAHMAHIGGFVAGLVLVKLFAAGSRPAYA